MALTKCKECEARVAVSALQCPQCGVLAPGYSDSQIKKGTSNFVISQVRFGLWFVLFLGLLFRFALAGMMPHPIFYQSVVTVGAWTVLAGLLGLILFESLLFIRRRWV
ncbi:MAG: hypothetical protein CMQ34_01350 [Gammaproteobacteria bacterium]|nr:hypothetical protein [Gammaproteobacteria bacterium]